MWIQSKTATGTNIAFDDYSIKTGTSATKISIIEMFTLALNKNYA
jgi:hypothetical protein